MAEDFKDGMDELRLPFVFVPHGAPDPVESMRSCAEPLRIPATFRPDPQPFHPHPDAYLPTGTQTAEFPHGTPACLGLIAPGYRPHSRFPHGGAPPYTDPKYDRTDPVAEYHRFNRMADEAARNYGSPDHAELTQAMMIKTAEIVRRHPQTKEAVRQASASFDTAIGLEGHDGARKHTEAGGNAPAANHAQLHEVADNPAQTTLISRLEHRLSAMADMLLHRIAYVFPTDPAGLTPVPLRDDKGHVVLDPKGRPMMRPAGMDPHYFVDKGLRDKRTETTLFSSGGDEVGSDFEGTELANFAWFGPWDAQRLGFEYHPQFRDYSTVVIGLYAAANGLSEEDILTIQNDAAAVKSNFGSKAIMDDTYKHLPIENVKNTELGFALYQSGRIAATSGR